MAISYFTMKGIKMNIFLLIIMEHFGFSPARSLVLQLIHFGPYAQYNLDRVFSL